MHLILDQIESKQYHFDVHRFSAPMMMESGSKKLYKKICEAMNKSDQIDQGSSSSDDEMDYSVLYAKV